jgi:hypothetical protein
VPDGGFNVHWYRALHLQARATRRNILKNRGAFASVFVTSTGFLSPLQINQVRTDGPVEKALVVHISLI